jgi:hypothetical protein
MIGYALGVRCAAVLPGRNKALIAAARYLVREVRRAELPAGRVGAVPARGIAGGERRGRALGHVVRYGLYLAIAGSVLAFFLPAADRLGTAKAVLELCVGGVLLLEGLLLVSNWHGARWRLVQRWVANRGGAAGMLDALRWRLFGYALFGLGLVWVAVGVVYLGQGALDL